MFGTSQPGGFRGTTYFFALGRSGALGYLMMWLCRRPAPIRRVPPPAPPDEPAALAWRGSFVIGMHAILYSTAPEKDRAFLTNVLGLPSVDAGDGWLIFRLPPAEIAIHPDKRGGHAELYFMCKDIRVTMAALRQKRVKVIHDVADRGWGLLASIALPSGAELGIYEPRHPTAIAKRRPSSRAGRAAKR